MSVQYKNPEVERARDRVRGKVAGLRRSVRLHLALTALGEGLIVLVGVGLFSLALDYFFRLSYATRLVQAALFGGFQLWFLINRVIGRLKAALPSDQLALAVERAYPALDCRLVSAIQFGEAPPKGPQMARYVAGEVIREADAMASPLDFAAVLDRPGLAKRLGLAALAVLLASIIGAKARMLDLDAPGENKSVAVLPIWFQRDVLLMDIDWPRSTRLEIGLENAEPGGSLGISLPEDPEQDGFTAPLSIPAGARLELPGAILASLAPSGAVIETGTLILSEGGRVRAPPGSSLVVTGQRFLQIPAGAELAIAAGARLELAGEELAIAGRSIKAGSALKLELLQGSGLAFPAETVFKVPDGASLRVTASVRGVIPRAVYAAWRPAEDEVSDLQRRLGTGQTPMAKVGEAEFRHGFPLVGESFYLELWGGDDEVGPFRVHVVRPPWVRSLAVEAKPPEYTKKPARVYTSDAGDLAVPEGSTLTLRGQASKPLTAGWLTIKAPLEKDKPPYRVPFEVDGPNLTTAVLVTQTLIAELDVEDSVDGLRIKNPPRLTFRAVLDEKPKVSLQTKGIGKIITAKASIPVELRANDDYGLTGGALSFRFTGPDPKDKTKTKEGKGALPVEAFSSGREGSASTLWEIEKIGLTPGLFLTFWAEAKDNDGLRGAKLGRAQSLTVRVVTPNELVDDLVRRQLEQKNRLEEAIQAEAKVLETIDKAIPDKTTGFRQARQQLVIGRTVRGIAKVMEQVFDEMRYNKLLDVETLDREAANILDPLTEVADELLPQSRRRIEEIYEAEDTGAVHDKARAEVGTILAMLKRVKAAMIDFEELVKLIKDLEGIIGDIEDVIGDTRKKTG